MRQAAKMYRRIFFSWGGKKNGYHWYP